MSCSLNNNNIMLSRLNEQMLVEQIQEQQQERQIENLLSRRKKMPTGFVRDPVYNQLYVDWAPVGRTRRTKTQMNLSSNVSKNKIQRHKEDLLTSHQKKHHSQSVQLPKISKKIAPRPQGIITQLSTCQPEKPKIRNPQTLRKPGAGNNVIWSSYQTHYNTLNSEEEEQKPAKLAKPYEQILSKKFKLNQMDKGQKKKKKPINKEWLETDILTLETYFIKLKKNRNQEAVEKVEMKDPDGQANYDKMGLPSKDKIPEFIRNYKPRNPLIQVDDLIKRPDFKIVFDEGESLYFGDVLKGNQNRVGIMSTKNYRFEGIWIKGQKSQGYEITSQGYYKGFFKQDKRHGQGEFHWKNGETYAGQWIKGVKHGSGMWKSGKGDTYIGQWRNGKVQGLGVHTSSNGQRYEGQFQSFLKQGKGKEVFPNGDTYEGQYQKGKPHGKGKYTWKNGIIFQGPFVDGYRHGKGMITAKNYVTFEGTFVRQKVTGYASLKYDNGDHYQGEFLKGKKHGKGIMKLQRQKKILSGIWENGEFNFGDEQKS